MSTEIEITETAKPTDTRQRADVDSKEGKAFLRKVVKECKGHAYKWSIGSETSEEPDTWFATFHKQINGELGSPDIDIHVRTNIAIRLTPEHFGCTEQKEYEDYSPLTVPEIRAIQFDYDDVIHFCDCALRGFTFRAERCLGSISSSKHGIVTIGVRARSYEAGYTTRIGTDTLIVNGQPVTFGSIRTSR